MHSQATGSIATIENKTDNQASRVQATRMSAAIVACLI